MICSDQHSLSLWEKNHDSCFFIKVRGGEGGGGYGGIWTLKRDRSFPVHNHTCRILESQSIPSFDNWIKSINQSADHYLPMKSWGEEATAPLVHVSSRCACSLENHRSSTLISYFDSRQKVGKSRLSKGNSLKDTAMGALLFLFFFFGGGGVEGFVLSLFVFFLEGGRVCFVFVWFF